jgi:hypothetical protein
MGRAAGGGDRAWWQCSRILSRDDWVGQSVDIDFDEVVPKIKQISRCAPQINALKYEVSGSDQDAVASIAYAALAMAVRRARKSFDKIDLADSMFPCLMAWQGIKGVGVVAMRQRIRIKGEKRWT